MQLRRSAPVAGHLSAIVLLSSGLVLAQTDEPKCQRRAPLGAEIDDVTRRVVLEDTRAYDEAALARMIGGR